LTADERIERGGLPSPWSLSAAAARARRALTPAPLVRHSPRPRLARSDVNLARSEFPLRHPLVSCLERSARTPWPTSCPSHSRYSTGSHEPSTSTTFFAPRNFRALDSASRDRRARRPSFSRSGEPWSTAMRMPASGSVSAWRRSRTTRTSRRWQLCTRPLSARDSRSSPATSASSVRRGSGSTWEKARLGYGSSGSSPTSPHRRW
jgi:hypothetical protein